MIRILLLVDCANDFDRNLLRGIVRYSRENGPWLFYRLPSYYRSIENGERSILEWAKAWKADAIIGQWNDDAMDLLKELNIPVVLQNYRHRSTTYSNLTGDYEGTGLMAARFFAERLFRNFAFFGVKGVVWSDERCKGYRSEVERIGGTFHAFETGKDSEKNREVLGRWLRELPKPVALFCCDDAHALIISEICKMENISIPEDVSLLGVDNDELICNISDPPISSIELEVEKGGYAVGKLLHRQIRKEFVGPFNVVINPIRIELRQSTEKHNIEDPYVLRIVQIHRAAYRGRSDDRCDHRADSAFAAQHRTQVQARHEHLHIPVCAEVPREAFCQPAADDRSPAGRDCRRGGFPRLQQHFADFQEVYGLLADRIPSAAFGRQIVRFSKHAFRFSTTDPWRCPVSLYYGVRSSGGSLCAT